MDDRFFLSIWLLERPWAGWLINATLSAMSAWLAYDLPFFRWAFAVLAIAFAIRGVVVYLRRNRAPSPTTDNRSPSD